MSRRASELEETPRCSTSSPGRYTMSSSGTGTSAISDGISRRLWTRRNSSSASCAARSSWKRATTVRASRRFASIGASSPVDSPSSVSATRTQSSPLASRSQSGIAWSLRLMTRPYIRFGSSRSPTKLPSDLLIFCTPLVPTSSGSVNTICGSCPYASCRSRPIRRLNFWSVPPSSTSARSRPSRSPAGAGTAAPAARSARAPRAASRSRRARAGARIGGTGRELEQAGGAERLEPLGVAAHLGALEIDHEPVLGELHLDVVLDLLGVSIGRAFVRPLGSPTRAV